MALSLRTSATKVKVNAHTLQFVPIIINYDLSICIVKKTIGQIPSCPSEFTRNLPKLSNFLCFLWFYQSNSALQMLLSILPLSYILSPWHDEKESYYIPQAGLELYTHIQFVNGHDLSVLLTLPFKYLDYRCTRGKSFSCSFLRKVHVYPLFAYIKQMLQKNTSFSEHLLRACHVPDSFIFLGDGTPCGI